ncbi:cell division inhibitor [Nonlabens dokdonensis]|uniref:Cell division inhibitor n=1 Tax=Nonlabens dokdonensis TaxID=328515 RepID=A0A1Z8AQZ7_9FLAO|nr:SRPBCC family protein [Nonlabens dokdonensis]OUS12598.1 cell division inhibitor [Nonlabens dokdonensis]
MKLYQFSSKQKLPITLDQAWEFLTDANNLKLLTPPELDMTVQYGTERGMYPGQLIEYSVTPLPFYKTNWVTHITQVEEKKFFVDEQMYGPYATWHHKHFISEIEGGILMEDLIHYRLPFGALGKLGAPFVKKKLEEIFRFRESALIKHFGAFEEVNKTNQEKNATQKHEILN